MSVHIERRMKTASATIAASGTNSTPVAVGSSSFGTFQISGVIEGTEITVQYSNEDAESKNWTNVPTRTDDPNPKTGVTNNGTYFIPLMAFSAKYIRFVSNAAGGENAAVTINVIMKG